MYHGYIGDTAKTVAVGGCDVRAQRLMDVTEQALYEGIAQAVPGNRVVDISRAVQNYVESQRVQRRAGVCRGTGWAGRCMKSRRCRILLKRGKIA
jgi:methionine aminopeptidase